MTASVILSILSLYSAGFLFIWAGVCGWKRFGRDKGQRFFLAGLILVGATLGPMMGTRTIFGISGYHTVDFYLSIAGQFLVSLSMVCFALYFANKNLNSKHYQAAKKILFVAGGIFILMFFYGLWDNALVGPHVSKWGTEYEPVGYARVVIVSLWLLILAVSFYSRVHFVLKAFKNKTMAGIDLYINLIFFLFLLFFIPEELGRMNTWKLVFSRVSSNAIAVSFYLVYTHNYLKEDKLLNNSE